ncbi:MAG TPA: antibiotic biosynthesis monooxygenase [Candidatus Rubrimentiphilum sp.]|nr:antibiotic biosynthesis monooxygenase [Candidatus Rubrimentiphilum sp.]
MSAGAVESSISRLLICACPRAGADDQFAAWPARLQKAGLAFPGCSSCEFWPPTPPDQEEWVGVMRFATIDALRQWRTSETYRNLISEAAPLVEGGRITELVGGAATEFYVQNSATEVIVTELKPGKEAAYRDWANRIDKMEGTFPGFRGSYVQPPEPGGNVWTTLLRFDTIEKLNAWLNSSQRAELLRESDDLVNHVVLQRVDTAFPGWVPHDPATGKSPPNWKTAVLVVLVLFPIVMLEVKFLNPHLRVLNSALATLIGNAISVALVTWPLMPIAIKGFRWWLFPEGRPRWVHIGGPAVAALGFAIELAVFWRLL